MHPDHRCLSLADIKKEAKVQLQQTRDRLHEQAQELQENVRHKKETLICTRSQISDELKEAKRDVQAMVEQLFADLLEEASQQIDSRVQHLTNYESSLQDVTHEPMKQLDDIINQNDDDQLVNTALVEKIKHQCEVAAQKLQEHVLPKQVEHFRYQLQNNVTSSALSNLLRLSVLPEDDGGQSTLSFSLDLLRPAEETFVGGPSTAQQDRVHYGSATSNSSEDIGLPNDDDEEHLCDNEEHDPCDDEEHDPYGDGEEYDPCDDKEYEPSDDDSDDNETFWSSAVEFIARPLKKTKIHTFTNAVYTLALVFDQIWAVLHDYSILVLTRDGDDVKTIQLVDDENREFCAFNLTQVPTKEIFATGWRKDDTRDWRTRDEYILCLTEDGVILSKYPGNYDIIQGNTTHVFALTSKTKAQPIKCVQAFVVTGSALQPVKRFPLDADYCDALMLVSDSFICVCRNRVDPTINQGNIIKYNFDGVKLAEYGRFSRKPSPADDVLRLPVTFALDEASNVLLLDTINHKLKVLDEAGNFHSCDVEERGAKGFKALWWPAGAFYILYLKRDKTSKLFMITEQ